MLARLLTIFDRIPRMDHRAANFAQTLALLDAERAYWNAYILRATCHGDIEYGQDQLDELNRMEANARG